MNNKVDVKESDNIQSKYMTKDELEHYSFGPWLVVIDNEDLVPPQYLEEKDKILSAKLSVKFPINKDRSEVKAGTLLYKEIISIFDDSVIIFKVSDEGVFQRKILRENIKYVTLGGELLHNYFAIGTVDEEVKINFYSISYRITSRVIELLREAFSDAKEREVNENLGYMNCYYLGLYKEFINSHPRMDNLKIIGYQPEVKVKVIGNKDSGLFDMFKGQKIDEVLFVTNGKELIIISGDMDKAQKATVDYSYKNVFIRYDAISDVSIIENEELEKTNKLIIKFNNNSIKIDVSETFKKESLMI